MAETNDVERKRRSRSGVPRARIAIIAVLAVAVSLIALGASEGAAEDIWRRASLICYECIGIG